VVDAPARHVLSLAEAPGHPHQAERGAYFELAGVRQPAPAPRLSRTPSPIPSAPPGLGADTDQILHELGRADFEIKELHETGAVA
jgi:alpha-methylacyl-CoA racemase